jgi:CHAD domain-containing protein
LAPGKWISDVQAATPIPDAARHVLTVRLEVVRDYLPLAMREPDKDPEHVHQLRVGTRRARAALDIFACCLPIKVYKGARKNLRNLRRVAGQARDWDVFLASLTQWGREQERKQRPGVDCLVGYVVAKREAAQLQLAEAGKKYPFDFDRFLAETVAAVHKPYDPCLRTVLNLAVPRLSSLLKELDAAASRNLDDYECLHRVRILGKRLRYAMEVFANCFPPVFGEQIYPMVEEMQEVLGNANDSHVARGRLETLATRLQRQVPGEWRRYEPGLESLLRYHQGRLPEERQRFRDWWTRWRQSGEAVFLALLENLGTDSLDTAAPQPAPTMNSGFPCLSGNSCQHRKSG